MRLKIGETEKVSIKGTARYSHKLQDGTPATTSLGKWGSYDLYIEATKSLDELGYKEGDEFEYSITIKRKR